jgi:hypothetical protein
VYQKKGYNLKTLKVKSDHYGDYEVEYLCSVDYSKGVIEAGEIEDLYTEFFGKTLFADWEKSWPENYPDKIKEAFPGQIKNLYYPTEKSAPGHPLCDDKSVRKFLQEVERRNGQIGKAKACKA